MDITEANNQAASAFITIIPPSLQNIPTEIRRNIFICLLVSTELAEASSIDQIERYGADVKYGLSPQVLLVCRLFHEEGKEILYGLNHFIVESLPNIRIESLNAIQPFTLCSPLTRWDNQPTTHLPTNSIQKTLLHRNQGIRLVRKWRIILSARLYELRSQDGLVELCRLLCELQVLSGGSLLRELDVCIIPKGVEVKHGYLDAVDMREILVPLELLRNIPRVSIRTASISEIPDFVCRDQWFDTPLVTKSMLPTAPYRRLLIDLMRGNSEVELSTKMFTALLEYAQAFERDPKFKKVMSLSFEEVATLMAGEFSTLSDNPFLNKEFHPKGLAHTIEAGLQRARYMIEIINGDITQTTKFKEERSVILQYLERQFFRISYASQELVEFVKLQKQKWGVFDPACTKQYNGFDMVIYTEAMVLLEDYVASFTRELDASTKRAVRAQFGLFGHRYEFMARETNLKRCRVAYNRRDPIIFRKYFQKVVGDMELQYFMILTTRSKLYDWDAGNRVPDIKITPLSSLEAWEIRWDIEEPTVTAITESEAQRIQHDLQRQIAQQIFLAQQTAAHENQASQGSDTVDGDGTDGQNVNIENNAEETHITGMELDELANWESLPYHEDDEFYELTFQLDDNQSRPPSIVNAPISSDSASENDFYEELFRDHPDDESFDLETEDENEFGEDLVNSGGAILHVLPWLADSASSLPHVFPWMTHSQQ
ncbi:hypothetical protein BCON_0452g00020 [Botryotinia convoluta]|uniref:Uncharacterized protein n=1 Tax=Botryotinia convoluta TaxID=54673 RepID=A0A4Z1HDX1_9HELO|nr:hypothetical protein BCON_0452g00020 [Botryotinia convoluta]